MAPPGTTDRFQALLASNKTWAANIKTTKPDLLPTLATGQSPPILWIGCADSRVPETTITGLAPGDIFVHRNIANVVLASDISCSAVLEYGVKHLHVKHVVVCGHSGCGGVKAALGNDRVGGGLDAWLAGVRRTREDLAAGEGWARLSPEEKAKRLVEENVRRGVRVVREDPNVVAKGAEVEVHGVVYDIASGTLKEVVCREGKEEQRLRLEHFTLAEGKAE